MPYAAGHKPIKAVLDADTFERVSYWADRHKLTVSAYVREAVLRALERENRDYDLPTAEVARLNQLVDAYTSLEDRVRSLEHICVSGFETITGLARGDSNYLIDDEDGVL